MEPRGHPGPELSAAGDAATASAGAHPCGGVDDAQRMLLPDPDTGVESYPAPLRQLVGNRAPPAAPYSAAALAGPPGSMSARAGLPTSAAAEGKAGMASAAVDYDCARVILHFDVDAMYAQVRQGLGPKPRENPDRALREPWHDALGGLPGASKVLGLI